MESRAKKAPIFVSEGEDASSIRCSQRNVHGLICVQSQEALKRVKEFSSYVNQAVRNNFDKEETRHSRLMKDEPLFNE